MSLSNYAENVALDAVFYAAGATRYVKLHIGDPGEDCTANAAANSTRQSTTFSQASGGASTSQTNLVWTNVPATETYTHVSIWTASSGGNALGSGALTPVAMTAGLSFGISAGDLDATID